MARISVVLPAPFGPSNPSSSPSPSDNDSPSSARVAPNDLRASLISSTAMSASRESAGPGWPPGTDAQIAVTTTYGEPGPAGPHFSRDERSRAADDRRRIACRGTGPNPNFAGAQLRHPRETSRPSFHTEVDPCA